MSCSSALARHALASALPFYCRSTTKENSMLKISIVEGRKQRWVVVEGKLVAPWSDELKTACERAGSGLNGRELVIDLKNVTTISQQGENLLLELMKRRGKSRGRGGVTEQILKKVAPQVPRK